MRSLHSILASLLAIGASTSCALATSDEPAAEPEYQASEQPTTLQQTTSATCSGRPGRLRGKSRQNIRAGGLNRSFVYYAPPGLDPNQPAPLVIVPHGYTMSGQQMFDITQYAKLADRENFIAVFPDGGPGAGPWNVGRGVCGNGTWVTGGNNDQAFVDAMIDFADADRCVDRDHVFMNGFSMGGYLAHETGCQNPKVRAIAPHSAGTHNLNACPRKTLPVLMLHYNPDSLISYNCGQDARNKWVQRNGCTLAAPDVEQVKGGRCEYYKNCAPGAQVAFCTFNEPLLGGGELLSGHGWAGGSKSGSGDLFSIPGPTSATEVSWAFFKKYAW